LKHGIVKINLLASSDHSILPRGCVIIYLHNLPNLECLLNEALLS